MQDWQALVHSPLAHWARVRPDAVAVDDGNEALTFAQLHAAIHMRVQHLNAAKSPATILLDAAQNPVPLVCDFIATNASGRCAALGDASWPPGQRAQVQRMVDEINAKSASSAYPASAGCSPFYIGFTSGSTGSPKGFRRHHQSWAESFRVCADTFGSATTGRILAPGYLSHSLFLFGALLGIWTGGGVQLQRRFSASQCLATLRAGGTPCLVAVPSQLLVMLQLAARRQIAPIADVRLVLISGARWMRQHTPALQALFPQARIVEFYGASEASFIAWMDADASAPPQVVGRAFSNVQLQIRNAGGDALPAGEVGQIWVKSPMLFIDYVGHADATAAERDGDWLSVRDMGSISADGLLTLVGRAQRMLVTNGKNLFPEELEAVLAEHPRVAAASVHGVDDALRGKQVWAVLQLRSDAAIHPLQTLADNALLADLQHWCRARLEAYKTPRRWLICHAADWPHTASGKTDHKAVAAMLPC